MSDSLKLRSAQKTNFMPNCLDLAANASKIFPVVQMPIVVLGFLRFTWLGMLNISQRNCRYLLSVTWKFFARLVSRTWLPGPSKIPKPELPNVNAGGAARA